MKILYLITARGGSKGLPGKNIKLLGGKPLLCYSIDMARQLTTDNNICLSTDNDEIANTATAYGLQVPFTRPGQLSSDTAGSREVILHALEHYRQKGITYDLVVLLQPTSPFRSKYDLQQMIAMYEPSLDMVVSVKIPHHNPYFSLFEENEAGFLELSKVNRAERRQDAPQVYAYNGSVYCINPASLNSKKLNEFRRVKKYIMDDVRSVDIDTQFDWYVAEMILEKSLLKI
jgi:CMP-N,N'-diacetyllegionaminic acid synthase